MRRAFTLAAAILLSAVLLPSSTAAQSPFSQVAMELTFTPEATGWKASAKFDIGGNQVAKAVQDLKVTGKQLTFFVEIEGAQVHFAGQLTEFLLAGTLEAKEKGTTIARGTWSLVPAKGDVAKGLGARWEGTFSAQMVPQQRADPNFSTQVARPAYTKKHPKVLFDEAHNNIHTASGLYLPFANLIMNDGYTVVPSSNKFQKSTLAGYDILLIANAAGPRGQRATPAFTDEEADAVRDWVSAGGSLLFISDHAPMGAAAEILAQRFGVDMSKGYTDDASSKDREVGDISFSRDNKLLGDHAITRGRNQSERVNRVVTFTGQSLKGPSNSNALLRLPDTAVDTYPGTEKTVSAAGRTQGLTITFGKGRVVVLGEAGMLSAQIDNKDRVFGMNYPNTDNRQLALNIMHWLSRLLN